MSDVKLRAHVIDVPGDGQEPIVALYDENLIEQVPEAVDFRSTIIDVDCTFSIVPKCVLAKNQRGNQFMTIMVTYNGWVSIFGNVT